MQRFDNFYADGRWHPAQGDEITLYNPTTEEPSAAVRFATVNQVRLATAAAAAALPAWSARPMGERAAILAAAGEALVAQADELARTLSAEVGTPIAQSRRLHVQTAIHTLLQAPRWAQQQQPQEGPGRTLVEQIPIGVAACVTPWNYPLYLAATKIVPALLSGASVVLKPSELAPASIAALVGAFERARLPPGVLNVVFGGAATGEALIRDRQVEVISFTGSTAVGRQIAAIGGGLLKKVSLELGGKSPSVVLPDAALARAVSGTLQKAFQNAGQTCTASSRLLVPQAQFSEACELAAAGARALRSGDPLDPQTELGPLISAAQRSRAMQLIATAVQQGAHLLAGGAGAPRPARGYFVPPTVFATADPALEIVQTEAFAPVLVIMAYRGLDHAVELANATPFGLSAAVWSADEAQAMAVARRVRAGSVSINGAHTHPDAPFGGFGASGLGRERGPLALEEFRATRSLHRDSGQRPPSDGPARAG
ncbi:MAG: aldehyde dehydrogenase family protein [Proteobacteria bacterium]|nr:aldehyde dehydrogenase family protein [Pseudomonadota bacterium]